MEYLFLMFVWLVLSGVVAAIAASRGRSGIGFFFLSLLISPLLAGIFALLSGSGGKKCPRCAETVKRDAQVCRFCGTQLFVLPPKSGSMKCSRCAETVQADAQVCRFCGAQFVSTDTQPQATVHQSSAMRQQTVSTSTGTPELAPVPDAAPLEPPRCVAAPLPLQETPHSPTNVARPVAAPASTKPTATIILYVALFLAPIILRILHSTLLGLPGMTVLLLLLVSAGLVGHFESVKDYAGKGPLDIWHVFRYKHKMVAIGALVASLLIECLAIAMGIACRLSTNRLESAMAVSEPCVLVQAWAKLDENTKELASDAQTDKVTEATRECKARKDATAKALADAEASRRETEYTEHCRDVVAHLSAGRFDAADEKVVESAPPKPEIYLGGAEGKDLAQRIATKDLQVADLNRAALPCGDAVRSAFAHAAAVSANAWEALRSGQVEAKLLSILTDGPRLSPDSAAALGRAAEGLAVDALKSGATQSEAPTSLCAIESRLLKAVSPSCQRLAQVLTAKHNAAVAQAKARDAQSKAKEAQCDALQKAYEACQARCNDMLLDGQDDLFDKRSAACDNSCTSRYKSKSCEDNSSEPVSAPADLPDIVSTLMRSRVLNVTQPVAQVSGADTTVDPVNQPVQSHTSISARMANTQSASASTARKECVHQCIASCNDDAACERNCVALKCR